MAYNIARFSLKTLVCPVRGPIVTADSDNFHHAVVRASLLRQLGDERRRASRRDCLDTGMINTIDVCGGVRRMHDVLARLRPNSSATLPVGHASYQGIS